MQLVPFASTVLVACAALAQLRTHAQGQLWIVDGLGGGHFLTAQPAIDAAQDGDTILIRDNSPCGSMVIDAKALTVIEQIGAGSGGACGSFTVRNLLPHQHVSVRGLQLDGILLQHNEGSVFLDRVSSGSSANFACSGPNPLPDGALHIEHCASVVVSFGGFHGGKGGALGGAGIWVEHSNAHFHSTGARGGFPTNAGALKGGPGLVVIDSFVRLSNGSLRGGCGPLGLAACESGGPGGAAIDVRSGPGPLLQNVALHAGFGGCPPPVPHCGRCGELGELVIGQVESLPEEGRELEVLLSPVPGGQDVIAQYHGLPGEVVFYAAHLTGHHAAYVPSMLGVIALPLPPLLFFAGGTTGQFGNWLELLHLPVLPPGLDVLNVHLQAVGITPAGQIRLTNPRLLSIL